MAARRDPRAAPRRDHHRGHLCPDGQAGDAATVIAILTILGFSLYDTVVIYDKIRENPETSAMVSRMGYADTVNYSLNQVFMRSVNTSLVVSSRSCRC